MPCRGHCNQTDFLDSQKSWGTDHVQTLCTRLFFVSPCMRAWEQGQIFLCCGLINSYQRVGRLSMQDWRGRAMYPIRKSRINLTTNMLNVYLSTWLTYEFFYNQQDSQSCPKALQKTAQCKSMRQQKHDFLFFPSFFLSSLFNNNNLRIV